MNPKKQLEDRARARASAYDVVRIPKMFIPHDPSREYIKGVYTLTQVNGKKQGRRRYLVVDLNSIDWGGGVIESPTATARDYLVVEKFKPARLRAGGQYRDYVAHPNFAQIGAEFCDGEYIDIRAAYFSIANLGGWDLSYLPGRWIAAGRPLNDFPFLDNRIARNALITSGEKKEKLPRVSCGKVIEKPAWNEHTNLNLVTFVTDVLFSIANLAVKAGAIYVNVDGVIVPNQTVGDAVKQIILDFGLMYSVKAAGGGGVGSMTAYQVGERIAGGYKKPARAGVRSALGDYDLRLALWLQKNLEYIKSKRGAE